MKLTKPQQELLDAIKAGGTVNYHPYMGRFNPHAYYSLWMPQGFQGPRHRGRCTAPAKALLKAGLLKKANESFRGHELVLVEQPESA